MSANNFIPLLESSNPQDATLFSIQARLSSITLDLVTVETNFTTAAAERALREIGKIQNDLITLKNNLKKVKQKQETLRKLQRTVNKTDIS